MIIAETERLVIRAFSIDDANLLYQYSNEESAKVELPDEVLEDRDHAITMIQMYNENYPSNYPLVYAIAL
ncbi:GNAT family N-acetyltransferase, partial [Ruminococcaceae bacterium OttesenSCG-928-L11]|nr:GNAT family N-acetyltransferase [Ruminococcaceae bacterium OttesenSCG-928-L11]